MTAPEQMLKPCPFCGGEAKQGGYAISPDGYFCACQKCGVYVDGYTDIPEAIAAWNTRPAPDELVEALRALLVETELPYGTRLLDCQDKARTALRNAGAAS
jgi:Lar family restriction alleviation protein